MKIEEGMYARTERNGICKIRKIKQDLIEYENSYCDFIDYKSMLFDIRKASHNLLGNENEPCLIEVGDYVNGSEVLNFENKYIEEKDKFICYGVITENCYLENANSFIIEKKIKNILTKEQYENNCYKVEDK